MRSLQHLPFLLAQAAEQTTEAAKKSSWPAIIMLVAVVAILFLAFQLGKIVAKRAHMPKEYSWRLGVIFCSIMLAVLVIWPKPKEWGVGWPPSWGVDLRGGYYLVYEAEVGEDTSEDRTSQLILALTKRLNPSGTSEIVIRSYGKNQVEIIVPEVDQFEIERIKGLITTAGALEFRIVADQSSKHADVTDFIEDERNRGKMEVLDDAGKKVGKWVMLDKSEDPDTGEFGFTYALGGWETIRDQRTKEIFKNGLPAGFDGNVEVLIWLGDIDFSSEKLMAETSVNGDDIRNCYASRDEMNQPSVAFNMKSAGASQMADMTGNHIPDKQAGFYHHLGIILDGRLISAPRLESTISDRGRISGNFTDKRVNFLVDVIKSGALPTALKKTPLSQNQMGALLGQDTIRKGQFAIGLSLMLVLVFIAFYYRFSGFVACLALLTNLVLIISLMILVKGTFTLPGLAGMVLTVGMSVDANVLIFERIREEIGKGSALRMAIRNGFAKASTTIVDANVTTLITAMVLYAIGTDQIRGFAVTLILGILMSMYTAIFCSRVVFDLAERTRRFDRLSMLRILGNTSIDFVSKRKLAAVFSIVLISAGLFAVFNRGQGLFDIDFTGGTSATIEMREPMDIADVKKRLASIVDENGETPQLLVTSVGMEGAKLDTVWKVNTSLSDIEELRIQIMTAFKSDSGSLLRSYSMSFSNIEAVTADTGNGGDAPQNNGGGENNTPKDGGKKNEPSKKGQSSILNDGTSFVSAPYVGPTIGPIQDDTKKDDTKKDDTKKDDTKKDDTKKDDTKKDDTKKDDTKKDDTKKDDTKKDDTKKDDTKKDDTKKDDTKKDDTKKDDTKKDDTKKDDTKKDDTKKDDTKKDDTKKDDTKKDDTKKDDTKKDDTKKDDTKKTGTDTTKSESTLPGDSALQPKLPATVATTKAKVTLGNPGDDETSKRRIDGKTLRKLIEDAAKRLNLTTREADITVSPDPFPSEPWTIESELRFSGWAVEILADEATTNKLLTELQTEFAQRPVFHSSNKFGGEVANNMKRVAVESLLASLIGIVAYIWIRFQRVVFGLAAVVALLHDVLVTLGAIALSAYAAGALGFLKIEEFKISLPIVAAFLTIIGYSLNDTIVVFDRIREVRGKSPELTSTMVNTSINQTLSRTLLTSLTTLLVVLILYWFGGSGIHGFAFALVVGVIVGTYSSIFVASPVLLWMMNLTTKRETGKSAAS